MVAVARWSAELLASFLPFYTSTLALPSVLVQTLKDPSPQAGAVAVFLSATMDVNFSISRKCSVMQGGSCSPIDRRA